MSADDTLPTLQLPFGRVNFPVSCSGTDDSTLLSHKYAGGSGHRVLANPLQPAPTPVPLHLQLTTTSSPLLLTATRCL